MTQPDRYKTITNRYEALGMPLPNSETMCTGQCEGTGYVPVHQNDPNDAEGNWHDLWLAAEAKKETDDGYHFVVCPRCGASGEDIPSRYEESKP